MPTGSEGNALLRIFVQDDREHAQEPNLAYLELALTRMLADLACLLS
jgi:hypothetical protein